MSAIVLLAKASHMAKPIIIGVENDTPSTLGGEAELI